MHSVWIVCLGKVKREISPSVRLAKARRVLDTHICRMFLIGRMANLAVTTCNVRSTLKTIEIELPERDSPVREHAGTKIFRVSVRGNVDIGEGLGNSAVR
jgi:hypothetical protein